MNQLIKIAFIGAGPAAIYCAKELVGHGFQMDIYDMNDDVGGATYTGIPGWRFNHHFMDKIVEELKENHTTFYFNTKVGRDISFQELQEKYDRIVVAIGAQVENSFGFEVKDGFEAGLTLLHRLNIEHLEEEYSKQFKHVIVWGGGNVAMDCCRSLKRIIDDVKIMYRRTEVEMPAYKNEIKDAKNEGVEFIFLENLKDVIRDEHGKLIGAKTVKMELGPKDVSGRASVHEIAGSESIRECDLVVAAIGQKVDFSVLDASLQRIDGSHQSTLPNVLITGDAYLGPKSIALAIKDGREVAKELLLSLEM